ncbi:PREDICTED: sphingomyelin phosphodiesterase 4 isoform X2 [Nicrophorus vespilloides]|uniref:Sphingomyelin phosphodiesterase 4 isoform X2 n=1 Tax=Nicrophorus vespilloides TaxID=110193 RepID=A0ABM1MDJ9_NICVS|nr:PREDICTED: sphingomyelin phosphodiesterase 4 isoform X2 [Nicrophorus vespilloides]
MYNSQAESETILHRMSTALTLKVDQRCADLTVLFERGTKKELATFFPMLIDNIFGPQGTFSWSLRTQLPQNNPNEFKVLLNFLKPMGPVFKLIYLLLQEPNIKYEFSLMYLPTKVKMMLDSSNIHPFYQEILQYNNQTKQITSLLLNPFDYYMFHFAYHLINPCQQRTTCDDQWDSVYYNLSVEYLSHFFPIDLNQQITPSVGYYSGKNPMQLPQTFQRTMRFKMSLFSDVQTPEVKTTMERHPRNEIWRSESILMAFVDFWLTNDQVCLHFDNLNMSLSNHLELPSADYIRIIRAVIKHMHAFASTMNFDATSLGELKKITLPMIQGRIYVFLRNLLYRWPLDESFRLVLELWLSFIQPWRYTHEAYEHYIEVAANTNQSAHRKDVKYADESYMQFIAENLLVYVVIFQQLLPRFARVDLSSPKNAQMLFRLTKVFSQPNLVPILRRLESVVENKNYSPTHVLHNNPLGLMPPLSPTTRWSTNTSGHIYDSTHIESPKKPCSNFMSMGSDPLASKYMSVVRQKLYELEGPNFCYKPLFTVQAAPEVYELLQIIKVSEMKSSELFEKQKQSEQRRGFFSFFTQPTDIDKISLLDRKKAPVFLAAAFEGLISIFGISEFIVPQQCFRPSESPCFAQCSDDSAADISSDLNSTNTVERALKQQSIRERMKCLKFDGDPDLMPIQSREIGFLVRMFYQASCFINQMEERRINQFHGRQDFAGRFVRYFLQPPMYVYKYEKRDGRSRRVRHLLPARVSLRRFANYNFWTLFIIATLIFRYLGFGSFAFLFLYVVWNVLVASFSAIFQSGRPVVQSVDLNNSMDD